MSEVSVVRWRRYGKDRLYVDGLDQCHSGWCDLTTGAIAVDDEGDRHAVQGAGDAWRASEPTVAVRRTADPTNSSTIRCLWLTPLAMNPRRPNNRSEQRANCRRGWTSPSLSTDRPSGPVRGR